jgi:Luciferase-like monooxygenase
MRVYSMLPQANWRDAGPAARYAEAAGFDAVMTVELGHDPLTPLAFAALETFRVELTPSVVVAFPRSPTTLAQQAWDLHAICRLKDYGTAWARKSPTTRYGSSPPAAPMTKSPQPLRPVSAAWPIRSTCDSLPPRPWV